MSLKYCNTCKEMIDINLMNKFMCKKCTSKKYKEYKEKVKKIDKILLENYICRKCKITKPISEFSKHNGKKRGVADWCNYCHKIDVTVLKWKIKLEMGGKCVDCEYNNILFLQFDHLYDKKSNVSILRSKKKIREEATKCQLLCPNCHYKKSTTDSFKQLKSKEELNKKNLYHRNRRDENRVFISKIKNKIGGCQKCNLKINNNNSSFHFDHLDQNDKFKEVSNLSKSCYSLKVIEKEIDKCRLLCANCHYEYTAIQLNWFKVANIKNIFDIKEINNFVINF